MVHEVWALDNTVLLKASNGFKMSPRVGGLEYFQFLYILQICIMSLKLFETLFCKSNRHIITNLVLRNLLSRGYHSRSGHSEPNSDQGSSNSASSDSGVDTAISNGPKSPGVEPASPMRDGEAPSVAEAVTEEVKATPLSPSASLSDSEADEQPSIHKIVNRFGLLSYHY